MPKHVTITAIARTLLAAAPAFGTPVTAPTNILFRDVYGSIAVQPTVGNAAVVSIQLETAVGSGVYQTIMDSFVAAGALAGSKRDAFFFHCPAGIRYKFTNGGLGGVTESIAYYSYDDIG